MYRTILIVLAAAVALAAGAGACTPLPSQPNAKPAAAGAHARSNHHKSKHHKAKHHKVRHHPAKHHKSGRHPSGHAATLHALAEPDAGIKPIYQLITGARKSVNLTIYELRDPVAEADLAADAARGVLVRVILDQHLEKSRNTATYDYLRRHGVHVVWAPAGTTYHQKTLTVDGTTSAIMTLNLVTEDYAGTRDFAVIDTNRADVAAIIATFNADFAGRSINPPHGTDLVWSPTNALPSILSIINGSTRTLAVENEEMNDPVVTDALIAAARRGVHVTVVMTAESEWDAALRELTSAGVHVRLFPDSTKALYIHAKAIVADASLPRRQVLVGSQNFSQASLGYNRELGIRTGNQAVVATIAATLAKDYADAASSGPQPSPVPTTTAGGPRCGAPANPLHLTLCPGGKLVTSPPAGVCKYFRCISSFSDGTGYMTECKDGEYSMSGGHKEACTDHGGATHPVYRN